jgi:hypothetical protein
MNIHTNLKSVVKKSEVTSDDAKFTQNQRSHMIIHSAAKTQFANINSLHFLDINIYKLPAEDRKE